MSKDIEIEYGDNFESEIDIIEDQYPDEFAEFTNLLIEKAKHDTATAIFKDLNIQIIEWHPHTWGRLQASPNYSKIKEKYLVEKNNG